MRSFRTVAIATLLHLTSLVCTLPVFAADPGIRWEIDNRFRYFKNASDFRAIAKAYEDLKNSSHNPKPTVLMSERYLEDNGLPGSNKAAGWAAGIFENTCGRLIDHRYSSCEVDGDRYLAPTSDISARLILRADGLGTGPCNWFVDGAVLDTVSMPVPCNQAVTTKKIKYDVDHKLEVRPDAGAPQSVDVVLKDILIVSLGDSFSAGEGNPEKPVRLKDDTANEYGDSSPGQLFPIRVQSLPDGDAGLNEFVLGKSAAGWTDAQCHRSVYSQHARAALQYALEHPHVSVTFLNYSCTGAEVYEGLLNAWWARANDVSDADSDDAPQLVKALRDLCKDADPYKKTEWAVKGKYDDEYNTAPADIAPCPSLVRPIDALLLSIGGNDAKFANMISGAMLNGTYRGPADKARAWVYGFWRSLDTPITFDVGVATARQVIGRRYLDLNTRLTSKKYLDVSAETVILSAYPHIAYSENGNHLCTQRNLGMDVHPIFGANAKAFTGAQNFVDQFHETMKKAMDDNHLPWKFAEQHVVLDKAPNNFKNDSLGMGHGICAAGTPESSKITAGFPRPSRRSTPFAWKPFAPSDWTPYSPKYRWFVTPNDAFLTDNYHDRGFQLVDPAQPVLAATWSGAFHPNALGQAAVADSVLIELREVLSAYEN